jgi:hypothetical protein
VHHGRVRTPILLATLVSFASPLARAERTTAITAGGLMTVTAASLEAQAEAQFGGRLALSWEHARIAMPATPGYAVDGLLVPELHVGTSQDDERIEALLGAGLRAELRMAQREMGLLRISARATFYAAVRGSIVGKARDPALELVFGEQIYLGKTARTRIVLEGGYYERRHDATDTMASRENASGVIFQIALGYLL